MRKGLTADKQARFKEQEKRSTARRKTGSLLTATSRIMPGINGWSAGWRGVEEQLGNLLARQKEIAQ